MSAPENPPAFPRVGEGFGNPLYDTPGMSLRDWFAGQSIAGLLGGKIASSGALENREDTLARAAYRIADAMLAEREAASLAQRSSGE